MSAKRESDFINAYDTITARLAQVQGLLAGLNTIYAMSEAGGDGVKHVLDPGHMRDALLGITDLVEQADGAAIMGLSGCRFVPAVGGAIS